MLARVLKFMLIAHLLFGCAWFWAFRFDALGVSLAGLWVPLAALVASFAFKFFLAALVNRGDPAPRASSAAWVRACGRELWCALKVFGWWQPFRSGATADWLPDRPGSQTGVVFIHGFLCNRGIWMRWLKALNDEGRAYSAITLEPVFGSIDGYVAQVETAIARVTAATGRPPILVCHSMGGLAARAWLRAAGPHGGQRVRHIITLGTPHHGTWLAKFSRAQNGREMRHGSPWVRELSGAPDNWSSRFTCWYSNCDNIVFPATTATLAGADNRLAAGVAHLELALDKHVMNACLETIRAS